jgi:hypothetical protein
MDARVIRPAILAAVLLVSMGARYQSTNYIVETADPNLAAQIGQAAEKYRHDLAIEWLGKAMPNWSQPCMMTVRVGPNLGAGGATTFVFDHGEVFGWRMSIQGSAERIFDSVLPHEITHMVYASHFRRPLPRWADEGGATSAECSSEKQKHRTMLVQFLRTGRGIAFGQLFAMTEYPPDVMPLYAQSYSLAEYLIMHGGRRKYMEFLTDGMQSGQWSEAVKRHYGDESLPALQNTWVNWVAQGFPELKRPETITAAVVPSSRAAPANSSIAGSATSLATSGRRARPEPNLMYRVPAKADEAANGEAMPSRQMVPVTAGSQVRAEPQALPINGWRTAGQPASPAETATAPPPAPPSPGAEPMQVTRPPTMEPSQQLILEWNQP